MEQYKQDFIEFMVRSKVLSFGDFVTKSGRQTPYFINTGKYHTGEHLQLLGQYYARSITAQLKDGFDVLFGPAYKGIPLVTATAMVLDRDYGHNVAYCFDRKEVKNHGEGGLLVGHKLRPGDRVLIVEDVTTAGTSIRHSVPILRDQASIHLAGLVVSVDRMERGKSDQAALVEIAQEFNMPTFAIVTLDEIIQHLTQHEVDGKQVITKTSLEKIKSYRAQYGPTK